MVSRGEQGSCGQWQSVLALQTEAQFLSPLLLGFSSQDRESCSSLWDRFCCDSFISSLLINFIHGKWLRNNLLIYKQISLIFRSLIACGT